MRRLAAYRLAAAVIALAAIVAPGAAVAAENDNFASATSISPLPYSDSGELAGNTVEPDEPQPCGPPRDATVWYKLTLPTSAPIRVDLNGSDFGSVMVSFYQELPTGDPPFGKLGFQTCIFTGQSREFVAEGGVTYYLQIGTAIGAAHWQVNVQAIPAPPNDHFANAIPITARPFDDNVDMTAATVEPGEPVFPGGMSIVASAWYSVTPDETTKLSVFHFSCCVQSMLTVYTGNSLTGLTAVGSRPSGSRLTFEAIAGTTYYIQIGRGLLFGGSAPMSFHLEVAPPPNANFFFFPSDPSRFETVQFIDQSSDPAQVGIASQDWQFGDGSTASGCCPSHLYPADGDYTAVLTVTTPDGRTASASLQVAVRTHDVAIAAFTVPSSARAGQLRRLTIELRNDLYPEIVEVQLLKSLPGGGQQVLGTVTQLLPVRPRNKTVPVPFNYIFTADDAAVGKVTFQAVARIIGARDFLPADNTAIATTRVRP